MFINKHKSKMLPPVYGAVFVWGSCLPGGLQGFHRNLCVLNGSVYMKPSNVGQLLLHDVFLVGAVGG